MDVARLVVDMDDDLHSRLKALAYLRGKRLRDLVIEWAEEEVKSLPAMAQPRPKAKPTDEGKGGLTYNHTPKPGPTVNEK